MRFTILGAVVAAMLFSQASPPRSTAIDLWDRGAVAFGIFVPNDSAARLAAYANPLYDFLFFNLESRYDAAAIKTVVEGLRSSRSPRKTLIVRIPPVERDGADALQIRITEAFGLGADVVTVPHVRSIEEATRIVWFFRDTGLEIWSAANRKGDRAAMLMIEDPDAAAQAKQIAGLKGYSILACGIGSLTQALGGNREAAEALNQRILTETKRAKLVNMITTTTRDVEARVKQGYLALIAQGPNADEVIKTGRAAARR